MPGGRKRDSVAIISKLNELRGDFRLNRDERRAEWTRHIYRFDHVANAAKILRSRELLSRTECLNRGLLKDDQANRGIIAQSPRTHGFARLYFRPRTPTQHRNEGMLREEDITEGAHCPAPVFLVFDAKRMLTRSEALFSDGNLATQSREAEVEKTAKFFTALPFHTIYHDSAFSAEDAEEIVFRRNAEILFPETVDLDDLQEIVCRTEPERATLLTLLGSQASNWLPIIRLEREGEFMFWGARDTRKSRTLVRDAQLEEGRIILSFATARGPYTARVRVKDMGRAERPLILDEVYTFPDFIGPRLIVPLSARPRRVALQVRINGCLACQVELDRARLVTTTGRR